jgi:hypothetical protein
LAFDAFDTLGSVSHPATEIVQRAAEELRGAVFRDDRQDGARSDLDEFPAEAFDRALTLLKEAEDCLDATLEDQSSVGEAMKRVREASDAIESTRGFVRWMPQEVVYARADALRLLDRLTGRW